jgi:hypothetical protein
MLECHVVLIEPYLSKVAVVVSPGCAVRCEQSRLVPAADMARCGRGRRALARKHTATSLDCGGAAGDFRAAQLECPPRVSLPLIHLLITTAAFQGANHPDNG